MKTTTLSVLVLVLLVGGTASRAQEISRTNVTSSAPLLLAKASPRFSPEILGTKALFTTLDKGDLTLSLQATGKKEVKPEGVTPTNMVLVPLMLRGKDPFPNLYYVHFEDNPGDKEVSRDDVGRMWKLTPRTTFLFPFGRWDTPGIEERITLGFCIHIKLK